MTSDFDRRLRSGDLESYRPTPLGFPEIDASLGGGLLSENIALVGGMQNVGKTILVTQAARHAAATGDVLPIVVCYEHSPLELLHRLLCMESIDPDGPRPEGVTREAIQSAVLAYYDAHPDPRERDRLNLQWILERVPGADRAWERMAPYLHRLWLVQGDGMDTTVETLGEYVKAARAMDFHRILLIVDYAQRVPVRALGGVGLSEAQRIDMVVRGLKGLAMTHHVPVLAVAAADDEGLRRQRVHVENLWGGVTVQYEPDVVLILNRDSLDSASGDRHVRLAIEKNRQGPSEVEWRHRLHGANYCLATRGERVADEESFQGERIGLRHKRQAPPGLHPVLAMLVLMAAQGADGGVRSLLARATTADDGGAAFIPEVAARLGLESVLQETEAGDRRER